MFNLSRWFKTTTWEDRLTEPAPRWKDLKKRACRWRQCGTSELHCRRDWYTDAPVDIQLRVLGIEFSQAVFTENATRALSLLDQMRNREQELKPVRKKRQVRKSIR